MIKIKEEDKKKYFYMFEEYTHNIPVIYSSLEGQYDGKLFVDSIENTKVAILFTQFAFHFITGEIASLDIIDRVDNMIFNEYIKEYKEKEAIVFAPNEKWNDILQEVFNRHNGIDDNRVLYKLNKEKFNELYNNRKIDLSYDKKIILEEENESTVKYPVCRIYNLKECITFCSAFMLANGHAEIDIKTEEKYRKLGYAKEAAFTLVNRLNYDGYEANWCSWSNKIGSRKLAESIGFEFKEEIKAFIWVEDECGKL